MRNRLSICISVYDKIEECFVLISILKTYVSVEKIVVVCSCTHSVKNFEEKYSYDEDVIVIYEGKIPVDNSSKATLSSSLTKRIWNSQAAGLNEASKYSPIVMHTHADGWPLEESFLIEQIQLISEKKALVTYRGAGLNYSSPKTKEPLGKIDDHFYFVSSVCVKKSNLLKLEIQDIDVEKFNIHGLLALWFKSEIGISNCYRYESFDDYLYWDESQVYTVKYIQPLLRPFVFGQRSKTIHCHISDFPENLGRALQCYYLNKYGFKKDEFYYFASKYGDERVFEKIKEIEIKLNKKLKLLGYDVNVFHRNLVNKERAVKVSIVDACVIFFKNIIRYNRFSKKLKIKRFDSNRES